MESHSRRPGSLAFLVIGFMLLASAILSFVPLFPCRYCSHERRELQDWLAEPVIRKYREEHPEEVAQVRAHIRQIDARCSACFHGRVHVWRTLMEGSH
jgi:hypothetical protein